MDRKPFVFLLLMAGAVLLMPDNARAQDPLVAEGREVYDTYCIVCHGDKGDGMGLMGVIHRVQQKGIVVYTYPRDFTGGMFKFRSTASGDLPTEEDLMRIVTDGIPRSGMPSHKDLTVDEREAVIAFIKTYSKRWQEEKPGTPVELGAAPDYVGSPESLARGKTLYADAGCNFCHGQTGQGDGSSAGDLKDNWGNKILPFDFTSGPLKGGTSSEDIYKTFVTGLDGTPMPSYQEALNKQQRWDIVSYCLKLMKGSSETTQK
jgi:mono/diheme cytochrome c family protein